MAIKIAASIIEGEIQWFKNSYGLPGAQIFDACAVAAVIEPDILQTKSMHVDIEMQGVHTRGRTEADISGRHQEEQNVDVGIGIDRDRFLSILFEGLG